MVEENCTTVMEFILLGLSDVPELRPVLFLVFLVIYGITVLANLGMTALIQVSSQLHTPMYFFLSHLSFVDFCYSSVIVPKMLANIINNDKIISFLGCMVQFYLFCTFAITEAFFLAVMAYDRFVAICNPLLYMVIMSRRLRVELVACCYLYASVCSLIHLCLALQIPSYKSSVINHFFCDLPPLLSLACSDVTANEVLLLIVVNSNEILTIVIILTSYLFILITILRMRSAEGRRKAFSTCASHLTAITVFHGTIIFIYCQPTSGNNWDVDKVTTVFYTVVIPMLNPLIYSLRNKDVKEALRKVLGSKYFPRKSSAGGPRLLATPLCLLPQPLPLENRDSSAGRGCVRRHRSVCTCGSVVTSDRQNKGTVSPQLECHPLETGPFSRRSKDQHKRNRDNKKSNDINQYLNQKSVSTDEGEDWRYVTEKVVQLVVSTEREREDGGGEPNMNWNSTYPTATCQSDAQPVVHEERHSLCAKHHVTDTSFNARSRQRQRVRFSAETGGAVRVCISPWEVAACELAEFRLSSVLTDCTMGSWNSTSVPDFILMGLADSEETQLVLFLLFLLIYLVTVLGNAGMILIIRLDPQLHSPMYFFLTHLSFLDLSYSSVITPKTLQNLLTSTKSISFPGCFTQMYFFVVFVAAECFLLSAMAYDRYVAICSPLHYPVIMSTRLCCALLTGSYMIGFVDSTVNAVCMSRLHFCNSNVIHHFFCDSSPILALSCSDTYDVEIMILILAGSNLVLSLITISGSYVSILSTILKINSTAGKKRAFSTCASHLLGVTIFYSTMMFTYLKPKESYSLGKDQVASVFYTIVIPMLNPLIYSLRNKEVKNAVIRVLQKREGSVQLK
ncbi:uncharacterized protein O8D03_012629 [Erethizon dorsatum]